MAYENLIGTQVQVNRALMRPTLIGGAEGDAFYIYFFPIIGLNIMGRFHWQVILISLLIFLICHTFFVWLANKKDPQMIAIFLRHLRYHQGYFPARAGWLAGPDRVYPSVYYGQHLKDQK